MLAGCATPRTVRDTMGQPERVTVADELAARKEVDELRRDVAGSANSTVIPRLLQTISKYPGTRAGVEARFLLGQAYESMGSSPDAVTLYTEYLRLAPAGQHAGEAQKRITMLQELYEARYPSAETLEAQLSRAREAIQADPDNVTNLMTLADLLWRRGNYERAGEAYAGIVERWPQYLNDATIQNRMNFMMDGTYIVMSPNEVRARQIEAQPIECINLNSFRSGRDLFTREARYYVVTGQVVNRGDSTLHGVEVVVTIYGFGNVVYDTTTVSIPRLNPKEIRAFSVRFSNFENIENINRYECVANFRQ